MGELMAKHMWKDRHQEVIDDSKKFAGQIAARYKAAYSYCLFKQLRKRLHGSQQELMLLEHRKWQNYNRPLYMGPVFVVFGNHRKWRRRFCVLQPDYTIEVYDTEQDFQASNRPRYACKHSSYDVVENVDNHLSQLVKEYMRDFGFVRDNVSHVVKKVAPLVDSTKRPTQHVLGLYHEFKGTFYMAVDSAVEKDKWLKSLQDAQRQLAGVHCDNPTRVEAFKLAIWQTCDAEEHCNISVKMAGTIEEITSDFITSYLSNGCKTMLQTQVKGDVYKKFKMWGMILKTLSATVQEIVDDIFPQLQANAEKEVEATQQKMMSSLSEISVTYDTLCSEIIDGLEPNFHDQLEIEILPKISDVVAETGGSMSALFREVQTIFLSLVENFEQHITSTSTEFANNLDRYFLNEMDFAPRNPETMNNVFQVILGKNSPFKTLYESFPKANRDVKHHARLCVLLQELLDSAICTFEVLCGEVVAKNGGHIQTAATDNIERRVLKKLNHDNFVTTKQFISESMREIVFEILKSSIYHDSKTKIRKYEDLVPSDFKPFLPVSSVVRDAVLDKLENDLRPLLMAAFKRLSRNNVGMVVSQSSSTINSNSSDTTPSGVEHAPSPGRNSEALQNEDHENNSESGSAERSQPQENEQDSQENPPSPCPNGFEKDGETGECLEKAQEKYVDENGEEILPQSDHSSIRSEEVEQHGSNEDREVNEDCAIGDHHEDRGSSDDRPDIEQDIGIKHEETGSPELSEADNHGQENVSVEHSDVVSDVPQIEHGSSDAGDVLSNQNNDESISTEKSDVVLDESVTEAFHMQENGHSLNGSSVNVKQSSQSAVHPDTEINRLQSQGYAEANELGVIEQIVQTGEEKLI